MIKDRQVKRLWQVLLSGKTLAQSADKTNMDEKTARKYRQLGRLPSEVASERLGGHGRTRSPRFGPKCMHSCPPCHAWHGGRAVTRLVDRHEGDKRTPMPSVRAAATNNSSHSQNGMSPS